jgi:hypothetical protein
VNGTDWTAIAAVATAAAAIVTAWMAWMTRKMAAHAGAQVSIARDTLESAHRPVVVSTARTARRPFPHEDAERPTVREHDGAYFVPIENIGSGAALNVHGVIFWRLEGEEGRTAYEVTTTVCVSPHPLQLAPGAHAELEFRPLTAEPISAPNLLVRIWYASASGVRYWTAEHLSSAVQGYRSRTGRWPMPPEIEEEAAVPDEFADVLARLRRDLLAERFGSRPSSAESGDRGQD